MNKEELEKKWDEFDTAFNTQQELMEREIECSFEVQSFGLLLKALILPEKTAGGLYLPDASRDAAATKYDIGLVIGMGPEAYKDPERFPGGPRCKVGDWVDFKPFEKQQKYYNNYLCFIINDDRVNYPIKDIKTVVRELRENKHQLKKE